MSTENNKSIVRRFYEEVVNTGNIDEIERQIAEDEWVVTCIVARGTHQGSWLGIKPTGKPVVFTVVNIDRVADGRIVEHGGAANMLGPLREIGAVKVVGPGE